MNNMKKIIFLLCLISSPLWAQQAFEKERKIKLFFFLSALALVSFVLFSVTNLLISFILSLATYYLLAPAVDFLERKNLSRLIWCSFNRKSFSFCSACFFNLSCSWASFCSCSAFFCLAMAMSASITKPIACAPAIMRMCSSTCRPR